MIIYRIAVNNKLTPEAFVSLRFARWRSNALRATRSLESLPAASCQLPVCMQLAVCHAMCQWDLFWLALAAAPLLCMLGSSGRLAALAASWPSQSPPLMPICLWVFSSRDPETSFNPFVPFLFPVREAGPLRNALSDTLDTGYCSYCNQSGQSTTIDYHPLTAHSLHPPHPTPSHCSTL